MCQLQIFNYSSPEGAGFLSVHKNERSPYSLCHPWHVYPRLLKEKHTKIVLRFVGTLVVWVAVDAALSHNDTQWWEPLLPGHVLF